MNNKTGIEAAREKAASLKVQTEEKEEAKEETRVAVENQLAALQGNSALAKMYQDAAGQGDENLGGELPQLKIHTANKSQGNELAEGGEPQDGYFFLKSEGKQYKEITGYILAVSEGFRAEGMQQPNGEKPRMVFNQIVSLVVANDNDYKSAIMYMSGTKLQNLWDFGKKASRFTKGKMRLPLYALRVTLTTDKVSHAYGSSWVVKFEIDRDSEGNPIIVLDEGLFTFLKDSREAALETVSRLIAAKVAEETHETAVTANTVVRDAQDAEEVGASVSDEVQGEQEEVPF